MRVTTLGMLTVDGVPVRGQRLATIVRALLAARGRPVSTGAIIESLWGVDAPRDAVGAVQALVSRVRRLGLTVVAVPDGYRLPIDGLSIDAVQATALVAQARQHLRAGEVDAARRATGDVRALLPAVPDLADPSVRSLMREVTTVRAEVELTRAGDAVDAGLESDLRVLVDGSPPDEPAAALLVRLLAAQGRDAEALEVVESLRRDLKERYGTDPSPVVAQAHVALLRGELSTTATEPLPAPVAWPVGSTLPAGWRRAATPLIGRDADLTAIMAELSGAVPVTIVGSGGAGKTRLAAEIARRTAAVQPAHVVELAGVRSPDAVAGTVAAALHGGELARGAPSMVDDPNRGDQADYPVRRAARDLVGLVVLDNCEHVLDAAAETVAQILSVAPRATVLATSRAPLGLAGEVVYRLRALGDDDALALLESRARAGGATLPWSPERALSLCHRLDNLPLALELAAARLRHMPIDEVLAGLDDRFGLLDEALRGLPERHASLWAMVDWSHDLLPPAVRELCWRLSVIPAPFTVDTAAGVSGTAAEPVRAGLATLVEQSLLTLDAGDDGAPRYRMLETVREYGEVRLDAAGQRPSPEGHLRPMRDLAMTGLVSWAAAHAADLAADFIGPAQVIALSRAAADADTLTAALRWAIGTGDEVSASDIARALFHLWMVQGRHVEVLDWSMPLLRVDDPVARRTSTIVNGSAAFSGSGGGAALSGSARGPLPDAERLAWTLFLITANGTIAPIATKRGLATSRRALRRLLAEREAQLSPRIAALAKYLPSVDIADLDQLLPIVRRLVAHADPLVQGFGLFLRAMSRDSDGDGELAIADTTTAYERFAAVGDQWMMGMAAQGVAARLATAARPGAEEWLRRGAAHLAVVGATKEAQSLQVQLDAQLALAGDDQAAKRLAETAADPGSEPLNVVIARVGLTEVAIRQGRHDEAAGQAEAVAAAAASVMPLAQGVVVARSAAAVLRLRTALIAPRPGDGGDAETFAVSQLRACRHEALSTGDAPCLGAWALAGAELAAERGRDDDARELWSLAVRLGTRAVYPFQEGTGSHLTRALGEPDQREPLLVPWRARPVPVVTARIRELMDGLLLEPPT